MPAAAPLTIIADELTLGSPAQQLVDRFLVGYARDGSFHHPPFAVTLVGGAGSERELRVKTRGLRVAEAPPKADALLVIARDVESALSGARPGARAFVHGTLAEDAAAALRLRALAGQRKVALIAGGAVGTTWRLPDVELPFGTALDEALIVVGGNEDRREFVGLDGLLPLIERRRRSAVGVRAVTALAGEAFFRAQDEGLFAPRLLAAALSRSHSPQGASVADGRTQDLMRPGLLRTLARDPLAYLVEHRDGLRTSVLLLDGVIGDVTFALRTRPGEVISAQLHRAGRPGQHHFNRLMPAIEQHLAGKAPWSVDRAVLCAGLLGAFRRARDKQGERLVTPELAG